MPSDLDAALVLLDRQQTFIEVLALENARTRADLKLARALVDQALQRPPLPSPLRVAPAFEVVPLPPIAPVTCKHCPTVFRPTPGHRTICDACRRRIAIQSRNTVPGAA